MATFVDFVIATQKDKILLANFLKANSVDELRGVCKGYDVSDEDFRKLLAAKNAATTESAATGVWPQY